MFFTPLYPLVSVSSQQGTYNGMCPLWKTTYISSASHESWNTATQQSQMLQSDSSSTEVKLKLNLCATGF